VLSNEQTAKTAWLEIGRWRPPGTSEPAEHVSPGRPFQRRAWLPCSAGDTPDERRCPITGFAAEDVLEAAFVYPRAAPERGRMMTLERGADKPRRPVQEWKPGTLLVAGAGTVAEHGDAAGDPDLGVLVDVAHERVLLGTPEALRSTFTRLVFLDPEYGRSFARESEHTLYDGTRVLAWRLEW
jgi:hypothetical protein